jgi:hypothetical protein
MRIVAVLFAIGAFLELYVALGERSPWATLFVGLVLAFLSNVAARVAVTQAATVNELQHRAIRAIKLRIARSLPTFAPASSAT